MKYCPDCQRIYEDEVQRCSECRALLGRNVKADDPVLLLRASMLECERIRGALADEGIPCEVRPWGGDFSAGVVTGYSPQGSAELFVPFAALERARAVQSAVTAPENGGQLPGESAESAGNPPETVAASDEASALPHAAGEENMPAMSRGKRIFWRIFSMILFILLVWAVVAGTDGIVGWIKQFF